MWYPNVFVKDGSVRLNNYIYLNSLSSWYFCIKDNID